MNDAFDELIKQTREKYKVSWEKSLKKYELFCKQQDDDFEFAKEYGYFLNWEVEKIIVNSQSKKLNIEYTLELPGLIMFIRTPDQLAH